jgi:hypothetical protein
MVKKEHPNELFRNPVQRLVKRNQSEVYISAFDISKSAVNSVQVFISTLANVRVPVLEMLIQISPPKEIKGE